MGEDKTKPGDSGTCGFCGYGDGYLGEQGDESTMYLHSAVRTGEPGDWKYERHPNALPETSADGTAMSPGQRIIWCGNCVSGLKHMFQRLDDHNLKAEHMALKFWLELDGPRWGAWSAETDEERAVTKKYQDDLAIHLDKLHRERRVGLLQQELFRRAGFDLTTRGWRP